MIQHTGVSEVENQKGKLYFNVTTTAILRSGEFQKAFYIHIPKTG